MVEYHVLHAKLHTIVKLIPVTTAAIVMLATENHMKLTNPLFITVCVLIVTECYRVKVLQGVSTIII